MSSTVIQSQQHQWLVELCSTRDIRVVKMSVNKTKLKFCLETQRVDGCSTDVVLRCNKNFSQHKKYACNTII